ncbi:MAG: DNA integrity scanning protein DisA [Thermoanaerobacteraceae bacterium]|nr:DNA integrity scanning protein DisA [Thermoanaerobacteraceae bacterium]
MKDTDRLLSALKLLAPGTPFREALDNVLRAKTGGLIIFDDSPEIMEIAEGGFDIDAPFSPAALYELAKMDGAIILSKDGSKILKANVHLVPQPSIPSQETGIRHRVADRVARQTGALVIAISQRRNLITLYKDSIKYIFRDVSFILTKANQALQTLEKHRMVMEKTLVNLSILEFEDIVTLHDVLKGMQKTEIVQRIVREIDMYIVQLGSEGRLIKMQLDELSSGVAEERLFLIKDYLIARGEKTAEQVAGLIAQCSTEEVRDLVSLSRILGYGGTLSSLDMSLSPKGYRLLAKLPRIPMPVIENLVDKFGTLQNILAADIEQLVEVDGIGEVRAKTIKEGLKKLQEQILLDKQI